MPAEPQASNEALLDETREISSLKEFLLDAGALVMLAWPFFLSSLSWVMMKTTDSSILGHAGTKYLEASSLSDLWTSSTGVFIMSGAAGVLASNAYGAGNKELVGIWIQVAYTVLFSVCVLVMVAWSVTGPVLRAFGRSEELSADAAYFAQVLMLCLPMRIAFSQLRILFSSQKIMWPAAKASVLAMLANLILGVILVFGYPIPNWHGYGFKACPWITTVVEYGQFFFFWLIFCVVLQLHKDCWPGFSCKHITKARINTYLHQYIPSSLSVASDFWRVSAIGAIASSLGDVNVAVWNTSYRVCWIVIIFVGSLAGAMSLNLGIALGAGDTGKAKRQVKAGLFVNLIVLCLLCTVIVFVPRLCAQIFSSDPVILDLFEESRYAMAAFVFTMNLAVFLERVPSTVGRPKTALWMGVVGSWLGQVPGAYLCTTYWRDDLVGLYTGSALGYALLCVLLAGASLSFNWDDLAREARERSEVVRQRAASEQLDQQQQQAAGQVPGGQNGAVAPSEEVHES